MRISVFAALSAICLVLASSSSMGLPDVALAEWKEETRPCDVARWAILPQPIFEFQVGEPTDPQQTGYFSYGPPEPSPKDFTAVANWGDGTTSPATVEGAGVGNCYKVSTPGHAYSGAGSYPFSFMVHDDSTGLDHTLARATFHIYSLVPSLIGGPSSRTIHAIVGVSWSGVVGEFSSEAYVENASYPYTAQIEWGDGGGMTQGTISVQNHKTFTVTGSHIYAQPLSEEVTVLLSTNGKLLGKWPASSVTAAPRLNSGGPLFARPRLVRRAILASIPAAHGPLYEIVFRLKRELPLTQSGQVEASVGIYSQSSPVARLDAVGADRCYVARVDGIGGHKLKLGGSYPFTITPGEESVARGDGHALLRKFASFKRLRRAARRYLGCA